MYLKSKKIIHRDLKLGNILLGQRLEVKVGDFGLALIMKDQDERLTEFCGTPNYMAPEMVESKKGYSFEVDVWAIGVIMYMMLIGKPPFQSESKKVLLQNIKNLNYEWPENQPVS